MTVVQQNGHSIDDADGRLATSGKSFVTPTDLAALSPTLWFRPGGVSAAPNAPVTSWADAGSVGKPYVQGTAAAQPVYRTGVRNGMPAVQFDGVNDLLVCNDGVDNPAVTAQTLMVAHQTTGDCNFVGPTGGANPQTNNQYRIGYPTADQLSTFDHALATQIGTTMPVGRGSWSVSTFWRDLTTYEFWQGNVLCGSGAHANPSNLAIGCIGALMPAGLLWVNGFIGEIVWWNSALTAPQKASAQNSLRTRWATA